MISCENLKVGYEERVIIDNLSLSIKKGEVVSIIGPNGCGKSTLLKSLSRMIKPISGDIYIQNENIKSEVTLKEINYPIKKGDSLGVIKYYNSDGIELGRLDIISENNLEEITFKNKMKIFIDTANVDEIRAANDLGVICGVTTNPSLIAKEGRVFEEVVKEIIKVGDEND